MANIVTAVDLGQGVQAFEVDTDPTVELPVGIQTGSLIFYAGVWYRKLASGVVSEMGPHAAAHLLGAVDQITTLPTSDQKAGLDAASPAITAANPVVTNSDPRIVATVFGTYHQYAASEGESTSTSNAYQQKLRMTTPSLPAGTYRVEWYFEWRYGSISDDFIARVQIDDTTTVTEVNIEPKDNTNYQPVNGFFVTTLTAGVHNVDLDWRGENTLDTTRIRCARLTIFRVS